MKVTPLPTCESFIHTLAGLAASCVLLAGCGGGNGASTSGTQSVTPSTPSTHVASAGGEAASNPASAPLPSFADEAASAASPVLAAAQVAESAKTGGSAASTAVAISTPAKPLATSTASGSTSAGTVTSTSATPRVVAAAPATAVMAAAENTSAPADSVTMHTMAATGAEAAAAPVACDLDLTRSFGTACFAAVTTKLGDGAIATFPNAKPGYRGSTQARCKAGAVTWSNETCTAATLLTGMAAAAKAPANLAANVSAAPAPNYQIGVYYFGGWKNNQLGASSATPWEAIKRFPDREPLLGRYAEDGTGVMSQQLKWMRQYGIDFVVFNWYWSRDNTPILEQAVKAYMAVPDKPAVKFAVQWSNHEDYNYTQAQLDAMFRYWVNNYFKRADYQLYNGKPVVYIFLAPTWARNAAAIGMTSAQLIARLNNVAKAAGLPGVSVIGGLWGGDKTQDYSASTGFAAFTMYNYQSPANIALQPLRSGNYSRSYAELHQAYANQWDWMIKNTSANFIVPMSSGWDKRPWGGSPDPLHDDSRSLPAEFAVHLQAAKAFMDSNATRTQRTGIVCCWNEFGEGSFVEPTKVDQFNYLQLIGNTFGAN